MTNQSLTSIVLIVDRSGSMAHIAKTTENALEEFINGQKKRPGDLTVDTVFFDDQYEERAVFVDPKEEKIDLKIDPRGMTAMFDAVGRKINSFGEILKSKKEGDRPGKILFVIATDGMENASKEFAQDEVAELVKEQREKYNWEFVFIGANQDAVLSAKGLNIPAGSAITYSAKDSGTESAVSSLGTYSTLLRSGKSAEFSSEDRKKAME